MSINIYNDLYTIQGAQAREDVIFQPGTFKVTMATLHHGKPRNEHPIGDFIQRIFLFEDMELFGITGWIDMLDTYNLVRNSLILGEELLYLKFETAGVDVAGLGSTWPVDFSKQPMQVHTVQNMKETASNAGASIQSGLTYRLHFCSPELLTNERVRVSRTLQGTYSDMVKDILKNDLKTTKNIEIEETEDLKHIVVPNMRPFDAIGQIVRSAQRMAKTGGNKPAGGGRGKKSSVSIFNGRQTDFYFWETSRGYKFLPALRPLENDFMLTIGGASAQVPYRETMMTSLSHAYIRTGDTLPSIPSGLWGGKQILYNNTTKNTWTVQSNYHTALKNTRYSLVSETPVFDPTSSFGTNVYDEPRRISDWPDSRVEFASYNGSSVTSINKDTGESGIPWVLVPSSLGLQRAIQTQHPMEYNKLSIQVNGMSALQAGMVVFLNLPDVGQGRGFVEGVAPIWEDRQDNIWIIKRLSHQLDARQDSFGYTCQLELTNTFRSTAKTLPKYSGLGSQNPLRRTPSKAEIWT